MQANIYSGSYNKSGIHPASFNTENLSREEDGEIKVIKQLTINKQSTIESNVKL